MQPPNPGSGSPHRVGEGNYVVKAGDCAFSIADAAGHFWETIWNHPRNSSLKELRGSPHVLLPGDQLFIRPIDVKYYDRATDARHRFKKKGIPIDFGLKVLRNGEPRSGIRYILAIEGRLTQGKIPEEGILNLKIMPSDRKGYLILHSGSQQEKYNLDFGHIDPPHAPSGVSTRLRNMGYLGRDKSEEAISDALSRFQRDHGLTPTGYLDDDNTTAQKLTEVHGS